MSGAKRAGLKPDAPGVERAGHVLGMGEDKVARWTATFDTLQIGAELIRNVPIGILDADHLDIDLLLGADFLRSHRVLFAMSQRKLYVSYVGGPALSHPRAGVEPWVQQEAAGGNANAQLGRAVMLRGDYASAVSLLRKALDAAPGGRQTALWLYVARARSGQAELGRKELETAFARKEDDWPWPIAAFHLGKFDEDKLLAQAGAERDQAHARVCQAWGHIVERRLIGGKTGQVQAAQARQGQACGTAAAGPQTPP